jgi:outer membrane protein
MHQASTHNSPRTFGLRILTAAVGILAASPLMAQSSLSLEEALKTAKDRNGTVRAAKLDYEAAKANVKASKAAFLPLVTPSATQQFGRSETFTGFRTKDNIDDLSSQIDVSWRLFDSGSRGLSLKQAEIGRESSALTSLQTLRRTLFTVHSSFYEALRRQELLRVQNEQVNRAKVILDQTKFRASDEVGDAPKKDVKQAEADFLNSQVSQLTATNRIQTAYADLKAVLGWGYEELPSLTSPQEFALKELDFTLDQAFKEGLANRADLLAESKRVEIAKIGVKQTSLAGALQYSVDATYRRSFSENVSDRSLLSFNVSYPLYDGFKSKEQVRSAKLGVESSEASFLQSQRAARAEIESAFKEYTQNSLRLQAAEKALDAARENYQAAVESQKEGAAGILEVLTAQVTLTTSESNLVEAKYDAILSEVRLRLAMGRPMPGEED